MPAIAVRPDVVVNPNPLENPPEVVAPKLVAGFDPEGNALPDDKVWGKLIGRTRRPLNTATAHKGEKIDGWEQRALMKHAKDDPRGFLTRLLADSMNGSPVEFSMTKALKGLGVIHATFRAENGAFETRIDLDVYNKTADKYLKSYLAKDARVKGSRSSVEVVVKGGLNKEAGIDDVQIDIAAKDLPKLSADKLMELDELRKDLRKALGEKSKAKREQGVKDVFERSVRRLSDFPLHFLIDLISDSDALSVDVRPKKGSTVHAHAEVGEGAYAVTFTDLLGDDDEDEEARIGAKLSGKASDDTNTISIDELKFYNEHPLTLTWEGDKPTVYRKDPATGEKKLVDDHVGELFQYLPLVMAFVAGGGL
jgi:hypothetical protein